MKTFKDYVTMNETKDNMIKTGEALTEAFKKGDSVTIKNAKSYDAMMKDTVQGTVIGAMGGKVMVKVGSGQLNVDPKDLMLAEDSDVEDEVDRELNEEDFSKIMSLIDKDIKQIRDNLFEDSKTIGKVRRTIINADRKGTLHNIKPLQEVEQLMDKARRILTKI